MAIFLPSRLEGHNLLSSEEFDCYDGFGQGAFQMRMLVLCSLAVYLVNTHTFVIPLTVKDVDHWCKRPPGLNMTNIEWRNVAIPTEAGGRYSSCLQYSNTYDQNDTRTLPCVAWEYDEEQAVTSAVSKWDLGCDRRPLRVALSFMHIAGAAIFGIAGGSVADSIGRRPVLLESTVILLSSTFGLCLATTYPVHAVIKFFASGSVNAFYIATGILFFEVTTHENRPLHVVIAGVVAAVASDLWVVMMTPLSIRWEFKQALFLAPTVLSAAAVCVAVESPRWLVAKARLEMAEDVMLVAAETNLFPLHNTAYLLDKLRKKVIDHNHQLQRTATLEILQGVSSRKRAFATFFAYLSLQFVLRVVNASSTMRQTPVLQWVSLALVVLSFLTMLLVITRVTMLQLISTCYVFLGVLQCILSLTITTDFTVVNQALLLSAKAVAFTGNIVCAVYNLELFPTAVRGTACGWIHALGALGAIIASVAIPLQYAGRNDVSFAMAGCLMFASLLALQTLPSNTTAECAKIAVRRASVFRQHNMERMKETLEQREPVHQTRGSKSVSINASERSRISTSRGSSRSWPH
ncbi:hypothetical protein V5799_025241 [Amblyomma americanum]|uniref:Organic cation/carnitine transporter n=1 Tax=Amblyomma americanum TaxID=6943 RepID=A0AAQ4E9W8_AMBAM